MREVEKERVARYKKSYPLDDREDKEILKKLNEVKKSYQYLNRLIERQVFENYVTDEWIKFRGKGSR